MLTDVDIIFGVRINPPSKTATSDSWRGFYWQKPGECDDDL